ncbi:MAG: bacillithiol system redox-active protein YtxJ [Bacteroidia bacterium]
MDWTPFTEPGQIEEIKAQSHSAFVLIFKHSHRCSISSVALHRLQAKWNLTSLQIHPYKLNVITARAISQEVAGTFGVRHESPQILLIKNGECIMHLSHLDISYSRITSAIDDKELAD